MSKLPQFYSDKSILVTGAAGSIGSEIVKKALAQGAKVVRAFDNNETGLFDLEKQINNENLRILIGDIKDKERCKRAIEGIDIVFHSAALKHVPLCEYNPFEAVKTNVIGTQNLIDAAIDENVQKFITISTDKAVNPVNVLGATKLLGEKLTVSANFYKGNKRSVFSCVRFGNVLGSRGSVVFTFKEQIEAGGPVTITNNDMTRFIMSISEAVDLILKAANMAEGGEVFILKMPAVKITDLAEVLIEALSIKNNQNPANIKVKTTGIRPGEKLHEELLTDLEASMTCEKDGILVLDSAGLEKENGDFKKECSIKGYVSNKVTLLTKAKVKKVLMELGLLE
jgi:UDP-N-acetylglucosamine 4,6-dehydratase/5-epimerase